jgi:hypothetical protein
MPHLTRDDNFNMMMPPAAYQDWTNSEEMDCSDLNPKF